MKADYFVFSFLIIILVSSAVCYMLMWPGEEKVKCSDQPVLRPRQKYPFLFQWLLFSIAMSLFVLIVLTEEIGFAFEEIKANWKTTLRLFAVITTGMLATLTLAIIFGNLFGRLSPDFVAVCNPVPSIARMCNNITGKGLEYVKVNCSSRPSDWVPARSSSFPRLITVLTYSMTAWALWGKYRMLNADDTFRFRIMGANSILVFSTGMSIGIGFIAIDEASADLMDVFTGYALGALMGWINMSFPHFLPNINIL